MKQCILHLRFRPGALAWTSGGAHPWVTWVTLKSVLTTLGLEGCEHGAFGPLLGEGFEFVRSHLQNNQSILSEKSKLKDLQIQKLLIDIIRINYISIWTCINHEYTNATSMLPKSRQTTRKPPMNHSSIEALRIETWAEENGAVSLREVPSWETEASLNGTVQQNHQRTHSPNFCGTYFANVVKVIDNLDMFLEEAWHKQFDVLGGHCQMVCLSFKLFFRMCFRN